MPIFEDFQKSANFWPTKPSKSVVAKPRNVPPQIGDLKPLRLHAGQNTERTHSGEYECHHERQRRAQQVPFECPSFSIALEQPQLQQIVDFSGCVKAIETWKTEHMYNRMEDSVKKAILESIIDAYNIYQNEADRMRRENLLDKCSHSSADLCAFVRTWQQRLNDLLSWLQKSDGFCDLEMMNELFGQWTFQCCINDWRYRTIETALLAGSTAMHQLLVSWLLDAKLAPAERTRWFIRPKIVPSSDDPTQLQRPRHSFNNSVLSAAQLTMNGIALLNMSLNNMSIAADTTTNHETPIMWASQHQQQLVLTVQLDVRVLPAPFCGEEHGRIVHQNAIMNVSAALNEFRAVAEFFSTDALRAYKRVFGFVSNLQLQRAQLDYTGQQLLRVMRQRLATRSESPHFRLAHYVLEEVLLLESIYIFDNVRATKDPHVLLAGLYPLLRGVLLALFIPSALSKLHESVQQCIRNASDFSATFVCSLNTRTRMCWMRCWHRPTTKAPQQMITSSNHDDGTATNDNISNHDDGTTTNDNISNHDDDDGTATNDNISNHEGGTVHRHDLSPARQKRNLHLTPSLRPSPPPPPRGEVPIADEILPQPQFIYNTTTTYSFYEHLTRAGQSVWELIVHTFIGTYGLLKRIFFRHIVSMPIKFAKMVAHFVKAVASSVWLSLKWLAQQIVGLPFTFVASLKEAVQFRMQNIANSVTEFGQTVYRKGANNDEQQTQICHQFDEAALLEKVRRMIREELRRFGSDRTGIVDYALESSGGSMLSTRCTVQYNERSRVHKLFGLPTLVHRLFTKNCYTGQNIATCIMGFVNVSMTVISVYMVERSGRRTLHLVGLLGTCVTTALLAASMHISEDALGKNVFFFLFHPAADSAVHPVCIQIFAGDKEQNVGASAGGDGPFAWQNTRLGERTNGQQINECDYRVRSLYFI
ncbi:hypothetical protein niasHS_002912 [Heterodera schachtii]|uniref:Uncharacterized protein n=1 Tax=Heterodera schachtii TaxID=97005 RepID=A0ABD2K963_HETSC